jgi:CDP-glucose 4,6-dehydratase
MVEKLTFPQWEGKNVLITGIGGFVGSHMAEALCSSGANIIGIIRNIPPSSREKGTYNMYVGDITDMNLVREVISNNEIDVIFHFAGYSIVRISSQDPMTTYHVNVMGTVSLLEAARSVGKCSKIIVASSDKAYGDHADLPYTEKHDLRPLNTYDTSKACMDMISRSYAHNYDMPISVVRCSNIYGPRDWNFSRLIPKTIVNIIKGKRPILYADIENMEREFIYIDDVIRGYDHVAKISDDLAPNVFNVGGNGPLKIIDVIRRICFLMGREDLEPTILERGATFKEIERQCIDSSRLFKLTNWQPDTSFDDGMMRTIEWYRKALDR